MTKAALIHAMGRVPVLSSILRWAASRYPEGSVVPIRSGFAKGMRWRRSHRYLNGYWLGQYELEIQAAVARLLGPGDRFLDLGANAGFFSLVAARAVGPGGACVSVDPDAANMRNMLVLKELNDLASWTVICRAVAERPGVMRFTTAAEGDTTGHLVRDGERAARAVEVTVTTIDAICEEHGLPRLIKMDIEGAEERALAGAAQTLRRLGTTWLIELHSTQNAIGVREIMAEAGYRFETLDGKAIPDEVPLGHYVVATPRGNGRGN